MSDTRPDTPPESPSATAASAPTQVFLDHRELLFSIVYNMLGSVADTEDVLQETWLAWAPRSPRRREETPTFSKMYLTDDHDDHIDERSSHQVRPRRGLNDPFIHEEVAR